MPKKKREFDWERPPAEGCVFIDIVEGCCGPSVSIGDESSGMRVAGPKPWGGGTTSKRFTARIADLRDALKPYIPELGKSAAHTNEETK